MRPSWRDLGPPLVAVALAALISALAGLVPFMPGGVLILLTGVAAGFGIVYWWSLARSARVARVNIEARRLLSPEHRTPQQAAARLGRPESDEGDDDVSRLRQTLSQLGGRMSAQVKEVAKKTQNLQSLLDAMHDPLVATNDADEVLFTNRAMETFAGAPRSTLSGRPIRGLFTRSEVLEIYTIARGGQPAGTRVNMTTEAGPRVFEASAKPLPAAWGEGVFGVLLILRDITELAQSVQVQKDFVANASHELRTPIAAIRMAAETLDNGAADDPPMRTRLLKAIADHVDRLEETIRDLMDLSRAENAAPAVQPGPVDLRSAVEALRPQLDPLLAERHLTLSVEIDPGTAGLVSDHKLVSLVLRNLIDNAAKFARPGTPVRVTGRRLPGGRVRVEVTDNGVGIPLAHQERVWERFYQVDPARSGMTGRRGTGLGLAIVRQAVTALKGECGLDSVWGEGTTVWFDLPERV